MRYQGQLKKWDANRGFGFIVADDGGQDIFVHVSAFARDAPMPVEGERFIFDIEPDRDGKKKAVRVSRPGVQPVRRAARPQMARHGGSASSRSGFGSKLVVLLILISLAAYFYSNYAKRVAQARAEQAELAAPEPPPVSLFVEPAKPVPVLPQPLPPPRVMPAPMIQSPSVASNFRCDGRRYCTQMTSCQEAKYFLANCPGVKMDGNGDGVPCEIQWCK